MFSGEIGPPYSSGTYNPALKEVLEKKLSYFQMHGREIVDG